MIKVMNKIISLVKYRLFHMIIKENVVVEGSDESLLDYDNRHVSEVAKMHFRGYPPPQPFPPSYKIN